MVTDDMLSTVAHVGFFLMTIRNIDGDRIHPCGASSSNPAVLVVAGTAVHSTKIAYGIV